MSQKWHVPWRHQMFEEILLKRWALHFSISLLLAIKNKHLGGWLLQFYRLVWVNLGCFYGQDSRLFLRKPKFNLLLCHWLPSKPQQLLVYAYVGQFQHPPSWNKPLQSLQIKRKWTSVLMVHPKRAWQWHHYKQPLFLGGRTQEFSLEFCYCKHLWE